REESLEQRRQKERQFAMQIADHRAQKEMMERQLAQQKEMMERQLAQQEKIMDWLQYKLAVWGSDQNSQTRMQSM
ncbi:hypothetical protein LTR74_018875, partial [Friedmanniomyces endolithicus]